MYMNSYTLWTCPVVYCSISSNTLSVILFLFPLILQSQTISLYNFKSLPSYYSFPHIVWLDPLSVILTFLSQFNPSMLDQNRLFLTHREFFSKNSSTTLKQNIVQTMTLWLYMARISVLVNSRVNWYMFLFRCVSISISAKFTNKQTDSLTHT